MSYQTQITVRKLSFISDIDLRNVLLDRLDELDRVFMVNANLSSIFLAISTIEGIFKHLATIYEKRIRQSQSYPEDNKGKQKAIDDLWIEQLYSLLQETGLFPSLPHFELVYKLFRDYRNFIHPQKQQKKDWPAGLGQAQMALGLLNATIDYLSGYLLVGEERFCIIEGTPDLKARNLHLALGNQPCNSFVLLESPITDRLKMDFDLEMPPKSLLNLVFNFVDNGNFQMIRLDNRNADRPFINSLLRSNGKYFWREYAFAQPSKPPSKTIFPVEVQLDVASTSFSFVVDGIPLIFTDLANDTLDLFKEFKPGLKVGLFNELAPLNLLNFTLAI
jgi:hypothetical protein